MKIEKATYKLLAERLKDYHNNPSEVENFANTLETLHIHLKSLENRDQDITQRALQANQDINEGRTFTQEEVEKLSDEWECAEFLNTAQKQELDKRYKTHSLNPYGEKDDDEFLREIE